MSEVEEVENLLNQATYPGVRGSLQNYLNKLKLTASQTESIPNVDTTNSSVSTGTSTVATPVSTLKPLVSFGQFIAIENFSWDQGPYNTPVVTVYVELDGVGSVKDDVKIQFGTHSFDLQVFGLNGKNYRLVKDNLDKDIIPNQSKIIVKQNKILIKLQKVKGEYSYENWNALSAKKPRNAETEAEKKKDPSSSLMSMMKDMYDDGDENMKKIIGEAMLKSKSGEKPETPSFDKPF